MNKIQKELEEKGWFNARIDKDVACPSWPKKHVRVTMWDSKNPVYRDGALGYGQYGHEYADGDGQTISEAFSHLKRNIEKGYCKHFPGSYDNPVEKDYKNYLAKKENSKKPVKLKK